MNSVRTKLAENRFRGAIIGALNSYSVESALFCSGFFQEDSHYSASRQFTLKRCRLPRRINLHVLGARIHIKDKLRL